MIQVVVGILQNAQGDVLVARRQQGKFQGGRWEFPGGKVEEGDADHFAALQRELHEEIGVDATAATSWMQLENSYPDGRVIHLDVWLVTQFQGEPYSKEGQEVKWVKTSTLSAMNIPDANLPIIEKLSSIAMLARF